MSKNGFRPRSNVSNISFAMGKIKISRKYTVGTLISMYFDDFSTIYLIF